MSSPGRPSRWRWSAWVALVPTVLAGLYGGMLADAVDRRLVLLLAAVVAWGSTAGIASLAWLGTETPLSLSLLTATNAVEPGTDRPRGSDSGGSRSGR